MSRIRVQCPNCSAPYRQNGRFCSVCGRARDEKSDAELAAEQTDPNRSVQMVASRTRTVSVPPPRRSRRTPATSAPTQAPPISSSLRLPGPGVLAAAALVFFGLVWMGRAANAPRNLLVPR